MPKGPKGQKRPADLNQRALSVVRIATGEAVGRPAKGARVAFQKGDVRCGDTNPAGGSRARRPGEQVTLLVGLRADPSHTTERHRAARQVVHDNSIVLRPGQNSPGRFFAQFATVVKLLVDAGSACSTFQDSALRNLPCKRVQVDEIWSFVGAKEKRGPYKKRAAQAQISD